MSGLVPRNQGSILQKAFIDSPVRILEPHPAIAVPATVSVAETLETLHLKNVGCVLVVDEAGVLSGIFTDRDAVTKKLWCGDPRSKQPIADFMTKSPQALRSSASIARAIHLMAIGGFRHVPVIPTKGEGLRVISITDLFRFIQQKVTSRVLKEDEKLFFDANALDLFFLCDLSIFSLHAPLVVTESTPVFDVAQGMLTSRRNAGFVLSESGTLRGIFTERDYVKKVALMQSGAESLQMSSVMVPSPRSLPVTASIAIAFNLMVEGGFRNLPLVDDKENVVGVLSVSHFIEFMAKQIVEGLQGR